MTVVAGGGGSSGASGVKNVAVTLNDVQANGDQESTTTQLIFVFSDVISGLSADDIELNSGEETINKGTLSGDNPYYLPISGFTSSINLTITVAKKGYDININSSTVFIYYVAPPIPISLNSVIANGSPTETTTQLTLTFDNEITGLSADDIELSGVNGITIGNLSGNNPYYLPISGFYFDTINKELTITFAKAGYLLENDSPSTTTIYYAAPITLNNVTANGSSTQITTQLTLTFDKAINGLSVNDITLSGVSGVTKGTLSGSNPYTLNISSFTSGGTLNVAVLKAGFSISGSPATTTIYYPVTLNSVTANGSSTVTTTQLTLTFDKAINGLSVDDITLSGVSDVTKGTLSGSNPYYLSISEFNGDFPYSGSLSVSVSKDGYSINNSPKTVTIYYYTPPIPTTLNSVNADGSSIQITTQLTITFDKTIIGLNADDIKLSGINGVNKGLLSGSNPYTLPISGFTSGGTLTITVAKDGYAISDSSKTTTIYYPVTLDSVSANGSSTVTTTQLTLTFDKAINGLSVNDITLSGVSGVTKGTLSGSNPYTLNISGFTSGGALNVAVSKANYSINGSPKTATIYYVVNLNSVSANGSSMVTTTQLTLTFDKAINGLSADDIILSGIDGVSKGTLSGSNPYTLNVSGFTSGGTLSVSVLKVNYSITGLPKTATISYAIPATLNSVTASGSSMVTTTHLTLTFDKEITDLTSADITLSGVSNVSKGTLNGSNPYILSVSGFTSGGTLSVAVSKAGYSISGTPKTATIYYATPATLISVSANGSLTQTTTNLTLAFDQVITGLSVSDITLSGMSGVTKGTLTRSGNSYSYYLNVSGITSDGTLEVSVSKSGYNISDSPKTTIVYYAIPVNLSIVTANGSYNEATTQLTLTFNAAIPNLTVDDITLSGVSGVSKGTLSVSGSVYTLPISGFTSNGNLNVAVLKNGYSIGGSPKSVSIYYAIPVTLNVSADGSSTQTTTQLTLTFSAPIPDLIANNITLSGVSGVSKGTLIGSNPYILPISGFTSGGTMTITVAKEGYAISGSMTATIYYFKMEMIQVPGGSFLMGKELGTAGIGDVTPTHTVTLSAFSMSKYEVMQEQYQAVMGSNPSNNTTSGKRPVERVSWYDALVFCNKLSIIEGLTPAYSISGSTAPSAWGAVPTSNNTTWNAVEIVSGSTGYRLPTEAQWEYAAKGGNSLGAYTYSGSNTPGNVAAWYGNTTQTSTVGISSPNGLGLYDMSGNVSEWCWDWSGDYTSAAQTNPVGVSSGTSRVVRGGSYTSSIGSIGGTQYNYLRIVQRDGIQPHQVSTAAGIRLALPSGGTTPVTLNSVTADGSSTQNTTNLTLTFSGMVIGLTANDITLSGVSSVSKGTLTGSNPYTLPISGLTSGGTLNVSVSKADYSISGSPKTVAVYYSIPVTLNSVSANGSSTQTTTQLTLNFDQTIAGLTAADITLSGVSGVSKGALSVSGSTYTLPINGFTSSGNLNVAVAKTGYLINGSPKTTTIYNITPVTLNSVVANGNSTNTTTQLTLTFDKPIAGLTASDIALSGVPRVVWGNLTGSNPYTLSIGGLTSGGTLNVSVSKEDYLISGVPKTATIYYYVILNSVIANGSSTETTTQLTLNFNHEVYGLSAADITLSGINNVSKGKISGSNPYYLPIGGFTSGGNLTVSVSKANSGSPKIVEIYNIFMEMISISGGSFQMGNSTPDTWTGQYETERPVHTVTLSAFKMGKYEVTQTQYQSVMLDNPSYFNSFSDITDGEYQWRRPVDSVSWYEALVFCNKLSVKEGLTPAYRISGSTDPDDWGAIPTSDNVTWSKVEIVTGSTGYRLPTEAQWEYAARGGNGSPGDYIYSGSNNIGDVAWYRYNNNGMTHEVGRKAPNGLGLYDMSGNVDEWCWDMFDFYSANAQTNPMTSSWLYNFPPNSSHDRMIRGGRNTERGYGYSPGDKGAYYSFLNGASCLGFRVVRP